jgi:uncharacterized membrane protein
VLQSELRLTLHKIQPQHQDFDRLMRQALQSRKAADKAAAAFCFWLMLCGTASAGFAVCNQTLDIANIAIAESGTGKLESRGWWVIAPNRCADVINGNLKSRYVYIHAVDARGMAMLDGSARFCTASRQFKVIGGGSCWQRGYTIGIFKEVDTKDAQSWTLFLRETPKS